VFFARSDFENDQKACFLAASQDLNDLRPAGSAASEIVHLKIQLPKPAPENLIA